jgi:hypothetical protein
MVNLREYIQAELNDAICLNQLNGADMRWTESRMEGLVNSIMYDIQEIGSDYDLDEIIKWNLDQNLSHS